MEENKTLKHERCGGMSATRTGTTTHVNGSMARGDDETQIPALAVVI
jgi:hypothetical protein